MFTSDDYKVAALMARDFAYHCRIATAPLMRLDLICTTARGESAVSVVCARESGWLYSVLSERRDCTSIRINSLVDNVDPYRVAAAQFEELPPPYDLVEMREKVLNTRYGHNGLPHEFSLEAGQDTEDLIYKAIVRARRSRLANANRHYRIHAGLSAKLALHIRRQSSANELDRQPRRPIKQMLGATNIMLSTTYYRVSSALPR